MQVCSRVGVEVWGSAVVATWRSGGVEVWRSGSEPDDQLKISVGFFEG